MSRPELTRRKFLVGAGATVGVLMAGCALALTETPTPSAEPTTTPTLPPNPSPTAPESPTPPPIGLRRRAAGMIVAGFAGRELAADDPILRAIAEEGIGGVILFSRNIVSPDQLVQLTGTLRQAAGDRPLLICVDQEGGLVARLEPDKGFAATPSAAQVGRRRDPEHALAVGRATGALLAEAGINLNLAPVVDLNVNPDNPSIGALGRSYSADPDVVVALAGAVIDGQRENGVLTTLKHFPGLGSATGDTDREFVDLTRTWSRPELEPFRQLIAAGRADVVMVGNALNGQLDREYPATLSAATLSVLRDDLGWTGVVITDDLQAGALRSGYADDQIVRLAIGAGSDLLLFANTQREPADVVTPTLDAIVRLVDQDKLDESRIDEAVRRLDTLLVGR